jgi:hypothetical protein
MENVPSREAEQSNLGIRPSPLAGEAGWGVVPSLDLERIFAR